MPELSPAMLVERLTSDVTGRPVEYVHSLHRGDRYRIVSRLTFGPTAACAELVGDHHQGIPPSDFGRLGPVASSTRGDVQRTPAHPLEGALSGTRPAGWTPNWSWGVVVSRGYRSGEVWPLCGSTHAAWGCRGSCAGRRGDRYTGTVYTVDRTAEMSNCSRTFSLTMEPPALRRWL